MSFSENSSVLVAPPNPKVHLQHSAFALEVASLHPFVAQGTQYSVLDSLWAGHVVPFDVVHQVFCIFELLLPGKTAVCLLWSDLNKVAILVRFHILQSLALDVTHLAGEGDVQPGVVGIFVAVSPIQSDLPPGRASSNPDFIRNYFPLKCVFDFFDIRDKCRKQGFFEGQYIY